MLGHTAHHQRIRQFAVVKTILKGGSFLLRLPDCDDHEVHATLCGKMRVSSIHLSIGDQVDVELSPYDLTRGRIVWRNSD